MKLRSMLVLALALLCAPALAQVTPGTTPLSIAKGGTNRTAPFTSNLPVIGNGSGALAQGTRSGNSTTFATSSGALTSGDCVKIDAGGNFVDSGAACGANSNTPFVQDFLAGTNFTAGTTTQLTLSNTPAAAAVVQISFDGVVQSHNTWSLSGAVVTFSAAIPLNTQVVEAQWSSPATIGGVGSLNALSGALNLVPGNGISVTPSGTNITIAVVLNTLCSVVPSACTLVFGYTNIAWYGTACNGLFIGGANFGGTSNLTINSGSPNLLSTGSTFTSADVGKSIWIPGAGVASAGLSTTILTFTDATHVVLAANASTTVTAVAVTQTNPLVYGTDDTAAIQAAMTATPVGGEMVIPGQLTGCLIKKQGANNYALVQDHPFNIRGRGHFSNLMTDPSMGSGVDAIVVQAGGFDWHGIVWQNFSIGDSASFTPPTFVMYTRHGRRAMWFSAAAYSSGFLNITVRNLMIGESSNDYSLYIDGAATQSLTVGPNNKIYGGINLDQIADSAAILNNTLLGSSSFGGKIRADFSGGFQFVGNNVTWAGGLKIESGSRPVVERNYFEEGFATLESNNALVDFNGAGTTISDPVFINNIVAANISSTSTPVRYGNSAGGIFGGNTISTLTNRTGVTSVGTLSCIAPNNWALVGGTHFSTALANTYAGC